MTYRSDKAEGPTAGTATVDPLEFLARLVTHIPEPGQVMQRYYGWYASRTRGARRRQASDAAEAPVAIVEPVDWSLRAARFRWVELLRRILEVDPLTCPRCQGLMRIVALITEPRRDHPDPRPLSPSPGPDPAGAEPPSAKARGPFARPGVPEEPAGRPRAARPAFQPPHPTRPRAAPTVVLGAAR